MPLPPAFRNHHWNNPRVFRYERIPVLLFLCLIAGVSVQAQNADASNKDRTPGIDRRYLDTQADPCMDFFQYACGNFSKLHPIPADRSSYGILEMVSERNQAALHAMLEEAADPKRQRAGNEQKIGDFYASCMDTSAINQRGLAPLKSELDRIAALKDKLELARLLAHEQLIGVNAFLGFGEAQDFKDARKQIAVLDQGGLGLPDRDYYFRSGDAAEATRAQYVHHIARMFELLGETEKQAQADSQKVMDVETALAKVSMDVTAQRDPNNVYHPMTKAELAKLAPDVRWEQFFASAGVPQILELNVTNPPFFKELNALIAATDLETIKVYLRWQLLNATPGYVLPDKIDAEDFDFYSRKLRGQPQQRERWQRCVAATDGALGEGLGQIYVKQEFPAASKASTLAMVHNIEAAMDRDIDAVDWMSQTTKLKAKEKLHFVANKIGYPDRWRDYSSLRIARGDAFGNQKRAAEFENRRQFAKIGQPIDRGEWEMSPPTVNAYYDPGMNNINFPAGILQPPLYDPKASDAENYGHIGAIIGHELTHGFDDQGRLFDKDGNLADWWTKEDADHFQAGSACLVHEYGSFTAVDDVKVNGRLTLGENTADNGGMRLAYLALIEELKQRGVSPQQKEDRLTPIQQFFLSFAQNWCGDTRPAQIRLQVQTNPHAPEMFRVNGVVENMPEFGSAFGCKAGQAMMPKSACRIW